MLGASHHLKVIETTDRKCSEKLCLLFETPRDYEIRDSLLCNKVQRIIKSGRMMEFARIVINFGRTGDYWSQ